MAAVTTTEGRGAAGAPVRALTVLYDAESALGTHLRDWLLRQPRLVPLEPLPAGSAAARARFPEPVLPAGREEITVVGDSGQVYRGSRAWIVLLWALREHRPLAHRLATPAGARTARDAVLTAAKWRDGQGRFGQGRGGQWGGLAYQRADGWSYHPRTGWSYSPPSHGGAAPASR